MGRGEEGEVREKGGPGKPEFFYKPRSRMSKFGIVGEDPPEFREKEGEGGSKGWILPNDPPTPSPCTA